MGIELPQAIADIRYSNPRPAYVEEYIEKPTLIEVFLKHVGDPASTRDAELSDAKAEIKNWPRCQQIGMVKAHYRFAKKRRETRKLLSMRFSLMSLRQKLYRTQTEPYLSTGSWKRVKHILRLGARDLASTSNQDKVSLYSSMVKLTNLHDLAQNILVAIPGPSARHANDANIVKPTRDETIGTMAKIDHIFHVNGLCRAIREFPLFINILKSLINICDIPIDVDEIAKKLLGQLNVLVI